jgi:peptidoglycan/xylan/chitin deacetylase (PgdA/CDA1 family)
MRWLLAFLLPVLSVLLPIPGGSKDGDDQPAVAATLPRLDIEVDAIAAAPPVPEKLRRLPPEYPVFLRPLAGEARHHANKGPRPMRELVLTFDDGPDLMGTPLVLEELDRRGLKGIFFVNGRHVLGTRPQDFARRDLLRKVAAHGHLIGNHTLSHQNVCNEPEKLAHQIDDNAELIANVTGQRPRLFRAPYGVRCKKLDQALAARDLLQVGWNMDPQEWLNGSDDLVYDYVTKKLAHFTGRAILLLHDTHGEAVRALPRILDWIAHENDRALRKGELPIVIRDYTVFLPAPPLGETGLEPFAADLGADLGATLAALPWTPLAR